MAKILSVVCRRTSHVIQGSFHSDVGQRDFLEYVTALKRVK